MVDVVETNPSRAPGRLELVRALVNTFDLEQGTDRLADVAAWQAWAAEHDVPGVSFGTEADLARLRELRESLRPALLANHDRGPMPSQTQAALSEALTWAGAQPVITEDGLRLRITAEGPRGLAGEIAAVVASAVQDGTWTRLKVCLDDSCRWAFYDRSRSRTGQWCSMQICGNRNKQARWRNRRQGPSQSGTVPGERLS